MTKLEFAEKLQKKSGLQSRTLACKVLDGVIDTLKEILGKGDTITFNGFGSFKVVKHASRKGRNPQTGKEIKIPARKSVKFTNSKNLKECVNKKK